MRHARSTAALLLATGCCAANGAPAAAQLPGLPPLLPLPTSLPNPTQILSDPGGVVTTVTSTVGGVVSGVPQQVAGALEQVLTGVVPGGGDSSGGGSGGVPGGGGILPGAGAHGGGGAPTGGETTGGGGLVPDDVLASLLAPLARVSGPVTTSVPSNGGRVLVDARPPAVSLEVLSHLKTIGRTGRLVLRVAASETGVVALKGAVRPGARLRRARGSSTARVLDLPAAVLGFRKAGALRVTMVLSRTAQRALGRARDARLSLTYVTADLARNQARGTLTRKLGR